MCDPLNFTMNERLKMPYNINGIQFLYLWLVLEKEQYVCKGQSSS